MKIYLAHNFAAGPGLLAQIVPLLTSLGHTITSTWITEREEAIGETRMANAIRDLQDLDSADAIIYFIEDFQGNGGRGKHFELGYALAAGKVCFLLDTMRPVDVGGPAGQIEQKQMVFLHHPQIIHLSRVWQGKYRSVEYPTLSQMFSLLPHFAAAAEFVNSSSRNLNTYASQVKLSNAKWWVDPVTGAVLTLESQITAKLLLIHSEISEACEGHRKGMADDKLPQYPMVAVELIDGLIRILDLLAHIEENQADYTPPATTAISTSWTIEEIYQAKMEYNRTRVDHTHKGRLAAGGKKY